MNLERFVIYASALFFVVYGLAFSILPVTMALLVTGSEPQGVSHLVDFRATYGGMTLAVGLSLLYLNAIQQARACLVLVVIVLMSMAVTRTVGLLVHGSGNFLMYLYLALEILGSVLAFIAMAQRPTESTDPRPDSHTVPATGVDQ